jgi:O-antigen ligase
VGILTALLPFVVSPAGYDKFRLPKDIVFLIAAFGAAALFLGRNRLSQFWRWKSWETAVLAGLVYVCLHTVLLGRADISSTALLMMAAAVALLLVLIWAIPGSFHQNAWLILGAAFGINGLFAVLQYFGRFPVMETTSGEILEGRHGPAGLLGEVNTGGFAFGLSALMLLFFLATRRKAGIRALAGIFLVLNLSGLAVSQTLSATGTFVAVFFAWLAFHVWWVARTRRNVRRAVALTFGVAALGLVLAIVGVTITGTGTRISAAWKAFSEGDLNQATSSRYPVYAITWEMIKERPWLGRGLNTFGADFFYYRVETDLWQLPMADLRGSFREVHNDYLQVWEELGLVGLVFFLALLVVPVISALKRARAAPDPRTLYWAVMLSLGVVFVALASLAQFPFHLSVTMLSIVWLFAGLRRIVNEAEEKPAASRRIDPPPAWGLVVPAVIVVAVCYVGVQRWLANSETGLASSILERAAAPQLPPLHKRVFVEAALTRLDSAEARTSVIWEIDNLQGSAFMLLGKYENAMREYEAAATRVPCPEVLTNLAAAAMARKDNEKAERLLTTALRYNPKYWKAIRALRYVRTGAKSGD